MITSNDLRAGMSILHNNELYEVIDTLQNKSARSQMIIKVKVRNMRSSAIVELTFTGGDKIQRAHIDKRDMQYLYDAGESIVFMDLESYEQIEIPKERLDWELNFMKENQTASVVFYKSEVLGVNLPEKITLEVTESEPAVKGDTATNAQKNAVVETGFEIRVPLFVEKGDKVILSTSDGKYISRA